MADFDIQSYLNLTGLSGRVKIGDKPNLDLLNLLVKNHVTHVPYQNIDLLLTRAEADLSPSAILKRTVIDKRGGMCFESSELMLQVLKTLQFDARRVSTFVMVNGQEYSEGVVLDHNIIIVHLEGKKYLIDVIFGFNAIRVPLEFSFEETEEKTVLPTEKYRLECHDDYYKLTVWVKGAFAPMYRFKRPFTYTDNQLLWANYQRFLNSPNKVMIRDEILKVGILSEIGRVGYTCQFLSKEKKGSPPYKRMEAKDINDVLQSEEVTYEEFRDSIKKIVNVPWNDDWFEK